MASHWTLDTIETPVRHASNHGPAETLCGDVEEYELEANRFTPNELLEMKRLALQEDIMAMIRIFQNSTDKPPFTAGQVLVMAIICSGGINVTRLQVLVWVSSTFEYYGRRRPFDSERMQQCGWYQLSNKSVDRAYDGSHPVQGLGDAIKDWKVPLVMDYKHSRSANHPTLLTVPPDAGRLYLAPLLTPPRAGTFDLFGLPKELRLVIYEMALGYPSCGLNPGPTQCVCAQHAWPPRPRIRSDELSTGMREVDHEDQYPNMRIGHMQEILGLLSVNKAVYQEALPIFYSINCFRGPCIQHLTSMIKGIHPSRRQHIRNVSFFYEPCLSETAERMQELSIALSALPRLRKVAVAAVWYIVEGIPYIPRDYWDHPPQTTDHPWTDFHDWVGIPQLCSVAAMAERMVVWNSPPGLCDYIRSQTATEIIVQEAGKTARLHGKPCESCDGYI